MSPSTGVFEVRILIVEDEAGLAERLAEAVVAAGFVADRASDGVEALYLGQTIDYDAVILDLGLPKISGLEVLRQWRAERRQMPVVILSARGTWSERVEGLNLGADDYMAKPFHAAEVVARLRALIRRSSGNPATKLQQGRVSIDLVANVASVEGTDVDLTAQELKVLVYLMQRPGRVISQADLAEHVYGMSDMRESNTIEVFIARLRAKLGREAIRTVRGLGYRMDGL
ncbi:MAG: DNA-binding response regulator [Rhodobacterales bacterium RIFCSPHIGHO2_02_FULL_62_130]|nr:MAG: DNA-binding response regulator [Rhodobacterales bacterium RIFCSPHIGHO2_02_FULL_62_130]OHC59139.1 MAG: DNA-binding response regulator [Rhodobacterales bacterium RIFCSPHIGHO2_12_FULL_62_75]HCZ00227.1 DNA-binding response regulator [Rhodobacter sp.]